MTTCEATWHVEPGAGMSSLRGAAVLVLALGFVSSLTGCKSLDERLRAAEIAGDTALASNRPEEAVEQYLKAMSLVARSGGAFDESKLAKAREAAKSESQLALRRARDMFPTNPRLARDFTERAIKLSGVNYGDDAATAKASSTYLAGTLKPYLAEQARIADERWKATRREAKTSAVMSLAQQVQSAETDWRSVNARDTELADPWLLKSRTQALRDSLRDDFNEMDPAQRGAMSTALISLEGAINRVEIWRGVNKPTFDKKLELMRDVNKSVTDLMSSAGTKTLAATEQPRTTPAALVSTGTPAARARTTTRTASSSNLPPSRNRTGNTPESGTTHRADEPDDLMAGIERADAGQAPVAQP